MSKAGYSFYISKWEKEKNKIRSIREKALLLDPESPILYVEQENDLECFHVIAYNGDGEAIGTGCLHPSGHIRDIVVLKAWQGNSVSSAILKYLLHISERLNLSGVWADVVDYKESFYESEGFIATNDDENSHESKHLRRMIKEIEVKRVVH